MYDTGSLNTIAPATRLYLPIANTFSQYKYLNTNVHTYVHIATYVYSYSQQTILYHDMLLFAF